MNNNETFISLVTLLSVSFYFHQSLHCQIVFIPLELSVKCLRNIIQIVRLSSSLFVWGTCEPLLRLSHSILVWCRMSSADGHTLTGVVRAGGT